MVLLPGNQRSKKGPFSRIPVALNSSRICAECMLSVCEVGWTPLAGFQSLACVLSTQFVPDLLSSVRPRWKETRELWKWPSRKPLWGHSQTGLEIICQDLVVTVFSCQWLQWGWGRGLQMYGRKVEMPCLFRHSQVLGEILGLGERELAGWGFFPSSPGRKQMS